MAQATKKKVNSAHRKVRTSSARSRKNTKSKNSNKNTKQVLPEITILPEAEEVVDETVVLDEVDCSPEIILHSSRRIMEDEDEIKMEPVEVAQEVKVETEAEQKPEFEAKSEVEVKAEPKEKTEAKTEKKQAPVIIAKTEKEPESVAEKKTEEIKAEPNSFVKVNIVTHEKKSNSAPKQNFPKSAIRRTQPVLIDGVRRATPKRKQPREDAVERTLVEASTKRGLKRARSARTIHFGWQRIALAFACAAAAVFAIVYFVNLNSPDITLKVAAIQSGIEASYPSYVPRDFSLSDITSENGKITLNFKNGTTGDAFTITEERSAWDSSALLSNYVRPTYSNDYTEIQEQGLKLYMSGSDAAWVNGGIVYKLVTTSGSLTKKQLKAIAVSL